MPLCDHLVQENIFHQFATCDVAQVVWHKLTTWLEVKMQLRDVQGIIHLIKSKQWKGFKKEIVTTFNGGLVYNI